MSPIISVIIPTYKRAKVLERAIKSVLCQTYPFIELIVVVDGADEATLELLNTYKNRLFFFVQENKGVSSARNLGVLKSKGEYIAFLDSDDEWHPNKLLLQINLAQTLDLNFIHCNEVWYRNNVRVNQMNKHKKGGGDQFIPSLSLCVISPSAVLMKKELLMAHNGFREDYPVCEDYDLWLKITSLQNVGYVETPLLNKYGGHEDQLSAKFIGMDYWRIKSLAWIFENRLLSIERKEELLKVLAKKIKILTNGYLKHNNLKNYDEIIQIKKRIFS